MNFDINENKDIVVLLGAGCMGLEIIKRISAGIIITPLAYDEFKAAGDNYQKMIDSSPTRRVGTASEVGEAGAFLLSHRASFITGTDLLIDGGVIASIKTGKYKLNR